jgi:hypothetical protein
MGAQAGLDMLCRGLRPVTAAATGDDEKGGIGVSVSSSCAAGQQTCATGSGLALAQSTEGGLAISDSQATAVNGQTAISAGGAMAGTSCQNGSAAVGSFVPNPDGSFTYSASMNSGFACTSASSGTTP